jgi:hypothetical protein
MLLSVACVGEIGFERHDVDALGESAPRTRHATRVQAVIPLTALIESKKSDAGAAQVLDRVIDTVDDGAVHASTREGTPGVTGVGLRNPLCDICETQPWKACS